MVDALGIKGDEGRGVPAISLGEVVATFDPGISEWGNPVPRNLHEFRCKPEWQTR